MPAPRIIRDKDGRELTRDEAIAAGLGHLLDDDAARSWQCDQCGRITWSEDERGQRCLMRRPNGLRCPGRIR